MDNQDLEVPVFVHLTRIENTTAQVKILEPNKGFKMGLVQVSGVTTKGIEVELRKDCCANGHLVVIDFLIVFDNSKKEMNATGKIISVNPIGEDRVNIAIEFRHYDKELWAKLLEKVSDRQDKLTELFESMKGA